MSDYWVRAREEATRRRSLEEFGLDSHGKPGEGFQQGRDMACILKSSL